jgi:Winged helix DNA-binding domain
MPARDLIAHLVGLQAQEPRDPYVGLWSRLVDFEAVELESLLLDREVVRLVVQRGTVHAVTADDCLVLRPLAQPVLTQQLHSHRDYAPLLKDVDLDTVMKHAARVLAEARNTRDLRAELAARFPQYDAAALAFACRNLLPFIQIPPRGLWSRSGQVVGTTARAWLGRDVDSNASVDDVMLRYLGAFGPATVQDAATWSRYTGLREVFDRLRPQLHAYRDEAGREYFDVLGVSIPEADTPAPVRLLPQYDNLLLSHRDRSRFIPAGFEIMNAIWMELRGFVGTVLVDGFLAGLWRIDDSKVPSRPPRRALTMTITTPRTLVDDVAAGVTDEAEKFLRFVDADAEHAVQFRAAR